MLKRQSKDIHVKAVRRALLLALLFAPLAALAAVAPPATPPPAPNWYDVELIVFQNTSPDAGVLESWSADPGAPAWEAAQALNPASSNLPYRLLPASSYHLDRDWAKLSHASQYMPLLHIAWAQPAIDHASAPFVQIGSPPAANGAVYGVARLSTTGPYLHFGLDLLFCGPPAKNVIPAPSTTPAVTTVQPAPPAAAAEAASLSATPGASASGCQPYRLRQDRKLEAGKLNYFDNPMFGALVLITPRPK